MYGLARMYQSEAIESVWETEFFENEKDAREWLNAL